MGAFHTFAGSSKYFGNDLFRGDNVQARVDVVVNQYMVAHVLFEHMAPGSFHAGKDPGYFFRVETSFRVNNLIPARSHAKAGAGS